MRKCRLGRKTEETEVTVYLDLDGKGRAEVETGIKFLDHLLSHLAKHSGFDLRVKARGDMEHHVAEDVMIVLGQCLEKALGKKEGIRRMGDAIVPMDETLVMVSVDLSGRGYSSVEMKLRSKKVEDLDADLLEHLLQTLAQNGKFNLHVKVLRGRNDHHKAEAVFKALGLALGEACSRRGRGIPSTKGVLS
ncbi:MAG: imidazoleglycerol-phosphate dehydratase HisB [Candidatus Hadarchaeales archaeon]